VPQSQIVFGQAGLPMHDKDYFAAFVLNHILGGGSFTSRLYQEVREKRGLAYGVSTYLYALDHADLYFGSTATTNEAAAETIRLIRAAAKKYLTGAYPLRFSEAKGLAEMLVGVQLNDFGADYFDKRNGYVEAVTVEDIKRVAKRLLDEKQLTFVVVGKPKGL
jgi:zinc protease